MDTTTSSDRVTEKTNSESSVLRTEVNLNQDDLSDEAKERFAIHDEILNAFRLTTRNILANNRLTPTGRHICCLATEWKYKCCKAVLNYNAAHPILKSGHQPTRSPLFLCGLPRTGTTLLYNLLACDPTCRAPLVTDMLDPVPPRPRSSSIRCTSFFEENRDILKMLGWIDCEGESLASHPSFVYEEDNVILSQAGFNWFLCCFAPEKENEFVKWCLNDKDKDFAYEYHRLFIDMLNSVDAPTSHWLFKHPLHGLYLDSLLRYYPNASLIMTHRRLDEVLPSFARLVFSFMNTFFDISEDGANTSRKTILEILLHIIDTCIRRLVDFRRSNRDVPALDVAYDDLVKQPINTVRRIYDYFKIPWSDDFETAMKDWLRNNPQGSQGRNAYSLEAFGLERETVERSYADYNNMFLKSSI